MAGLRAIGMVFGMLWLLFVLVVGFGGTYLDHQLHSAPESVSNVDDTADRSDRDRYTSQHDEWEREIDREREGVHIDTDSTRPMVDPDPSHRY